MGNVTVPDILSLSKLSRNVSGLKSQLDTTRREAVTGRYDDITLHLRGDVGSAHLLRKAIDDAQNAQTNLSLVASRATITQTTLGNIGNDSSDIATQLLSAVGRDDLFTIDNIAADAKASLFNTFVTLNTKLGERSLFGGDETSIPPLAPATQLMADIEAIMAGATDAADAKAQLDFYFDDPAGGFATSIYLGGANRAPKTELGPGVRIDISAKADDPAIKEIMRGLVTVAAIKSATFSDRNTLVVDGANNILDGEIALTEQRANLGVNEARIETTIERFAAEETVLITLFNRQTARDPFEAASQLKLLETQLEASYLMTARLANLSLANFLR